MKKFFKRLLIALLCLFILLQFYPRHNNNIAAETSSKDISKVYNVPSTVQAILKASCYDCHSNHTTYPWYASVQPVSLWLEDHIKEGKAELNFSEFGNYSLRRQYRKLEEVIDEVKEDAMPLSSYTLIHRSAKLNAEQKAIITGWSAALRDSFTVWYPADSLLRKK